MRLLNFIALAGFVITSAGCGGQRSEPEKPRIAVAAQAAPPTPVEKQAQEATPPPSEESVFKEWVASQLEARGVLFVGITERKLWPLAPEPNTSIVLGLAKRPAPATFGIPFVYFPYILLIQTTENPLPPKLLGLALRTDLNMDDPKNPYSDRRPKAIHIGPFQITINEYAFGVSVIEGSVGNKSGMLYELIGLYRYQDGELKEIYRDALWVYSKYSEPDFSSCNVDLEIATQAAVSGRYYTITRQYKRSYVMRPGSAEENPVASCSLTRIFEPPYTQMWNSDKEVYLDHMGQFLQEDDFGKGYFPR